MTVNVASPRIRGFDRAPLYDRIRPGYPGPAVDWLCERAGAAPGAVVADVGAGTGKLTRELADRGYSVLAVEPNERMRGVLEERCPGVSAYAATAESLPFTALSVDLVTVAQAFHLFDVAGAAREFHRVLRPGRRLVLLWNRRVQDEVHDKVAELTEPLRGDIPALRAEAWKEPLAEAGLFDAFEYARFHHRQLLSRAGLVERTLSTPYVAAAPAERQEELKARLGELVATLPEPIRLDYHTEVHVASRVDRVPPGGLSRR